MYMPSYKVRITFLSPSHPYLFFLKAKRFQKPSPSVEPQRLGVGNAAKFAAINATGSRHSLADLEFAFFQYPHPPPSVMTPFLTPNEHRRLYCGNRDGRH